MHTPVTNTLILPFVILGSNFFIEERFVHLYYCLLLIIKIVSQNATAGNLFNMYIDSYGFREKTANYDKLNAKVNSIVFTNK